MVEKKKLKIQTLIFNARYYPNKRAIKNWLKNNPEYKIMKHKRNPIIKKDKTFEVKQREAWFFKSSTLKLRNVTKSGTIKMRIGKLK